MIETTPVKMPQPPAIMKSGGKTYAVGGIWVQIPDGTTIKELHKYVVYTPLEVKKPLQRFAVSSSNGRTKYTVEVWQDKVTCNCSGYRWRNKCKHASAVQKAVINRPRGKG